MHFSLGLLDSQYIMEWYRIAGDFNDLCRYGELHEPPCTLHNKNTPRSELILITDSHWPHGDTEVMKEINSPE